MQVTRMQQGHSVADGGGDQLFAGHHHFIEPTGVAHQFEVLGLFAQHPDGVVLVFGGKVQEDVFGAHVFLKVADHALQGQHFLFAFVEVFQPFVEGIFVDLDVFAHQLALEDLGVDHLLDDLFGHFELLGRVRSGQEFFGHGDTSFEYRGHQCFYLNSRFILTRI